MSVLLTLAGMSALCWPAGTAAPRLRSLFDLPTARVATERHRTAVCRLASCAGAAGAALVLGPAGAAAFAIFAGALWWRLRARRRDRDSIAAAETMAEALRTLVAELRAGTHPAVAAESAATDAGPSTARTLRSIAATVRLGGDLGPGSFPAERRRSPAVDQLIRAWSLAQRHGLPLADLLDAVRRDVESSARFAGQAAAKMSGPRASAAILAVLPAAGVVLGEAIGARPLQVLGDTGAGQVLLLVGSALTCVGIAWSVRLTDTAVLR